jgi:hypothetical protein
MAEFLKILSVFFTCLFFFGKLGVPTAVVLFKYNFWKVMLVSIAGGVSGNIIFTNLSAGIIKWRHNFRLKRGKIHRKKIFTRFNRRIIKIKQRFGLAGIAFITPMIGMPVGALLAERFFKDKKRVIFYLSISVVFWALTIYLFLLMFHSSLTGWLV